jgi:Tol biopolymer transport system component
VRGLRYLLPAVVAIVACAGAGASEERVLAVSAYDAPSFGREIQLIGQDGRRIRIAPHSALPIDGAWSPDGKRIAFSGGDATSSQGGGYRAIYTSDSRGKDVHLVYEAKAGPSYSVFLFIPSWSPDGKRLSFSVDGAGPWVVDADGRNARRLASLGVGEWAAWSPDGSKLAFAGRTKAGDESVYSVRADGTGLRRLTRRLTGRERGVEAGIVDVAWAPNGRQVAFTRISFSPRAEIDVVGADGQNEHRIAWGGCPVWSPHGAVAFYAEDGKGHNTGIGVLRPGQRSPTLVVKRRGVSCTVWSADGRRLFFFAGGRGPFVVNAKGRAALRRPSRGERLTPIASQIWSKDGRLLDVDGDFDENWYEVRIVTLGGDVTKLSWADDHGPVWSPDGQKIAFTRTANKTDTVYVEDDGGGDPRRLLAGSDPAWSPDGKFIAFERKKRVFVVPEGGGPPRELAVGTHPVWSPDGSWIATVNPGLRVTAFDGGATRRLDQARPDCAGSATALPESVATPSWSHDGALLAFEYYMEDCDAATLAVVRSDGTSERDLADTYDEGPAEWTSDDRHLVFVDQAEQLASIALDGGEHRVLQARRVRSYSVTSDGRLVAAATDADQGTQVWLISIDGTDRRLLLASGFDTDLAWRP